MPEITDAAGSALEMIHCASLVHDDLPCFDNGDTRRGKPTVHKAYGENTAVLAGDSLIINAFNCLASVSKYSQTRSANLTLCLSKYAGFPNGICAGQGWENESNIDLKSYHMSKTGALFIAATQMGAASAGHDPEPWFELGARIGEAFQVADDLIDVLSDDVNSGKSVGQDEKNNRPNAIREFGVEGAKRHLQDILAGAISSIPSCPGEGELAQLVKMQATRMLEINDSKIIV
jgi:geranylgeranyl diphosphate synthase type II